MSKAENRGEGLGPEFSSFENSFDDVEEILGEENSPERWVGGVKDALTEDFIYSEVVEKVVPGVVDSLKETLGDEVSDEEVVEAIRDGGEHGDGELYERILELVVEAENQGKDHAIDQSIFDNKIEVGDAFGVDYILRGGKRLRPAMTILTEYALEDEVTGKSAMVGTAQEIVHASSLEHDDDMDGDILRRGKLTSERVNRALHGEDGWKQTVLDGNRLEAWANEAITSIIDDPSEDFNGIPRDAAIKFFRMEAELNGGQKQDIEMEDYELRETDLSDYEGMIAGKTGSLFKSGVEIMVADHLQNASYSSNDLREMTPGLVQDIIGDLQDEGQDERYGNAVRESVAGMTGRHIDEIDHDIIGETVEEEGVELVGEIVDNSQEGFERYVTDLFSQYMTSFNRLFQAGDDAIEIFKPDKTGKSTTDVDNRKITFVAERTGHGLEEESEEYADLFMDVFDGVYDEVTGEMKETASEMHEDAMGRDEVLEEVYAESDELDAEDMDLTIPEDAEQGGEWEEEWITHAIRMYGREPSENKAEEYLETAHDAVEKLYGLGVINEDSRQKYDDLAEFVWTRDH